MPIVARPQVVSMEDREADLAAREIECRATLRELQGAHGDYLWSALPEGTSPESVPADFAQVEQTRRRTQGEQAKLREERRSLMAALQTADSRLLELQQAGKTVRLGGVGALRRLLQRRGVSRPLHNFLSQLVSAQPPP